MNGRPLTMEAAWQVEDRVREDGRVVWLEEPGGFEVEYRRKAGASPKVWADAYMVAMARRAGAQLVTMDRALAARGCGALLV